MSSLRPHRPSALALLALLCLPLAACGGDDCEGDACAVDAGAAPDTGPADLGPPDLGPLDSGVLGDAGHVTAADSCLPCRNGACSGGGLCVTAGANEFCVDRCDDDIDSCLAGFSCVNIAAEGQPAVNVCVPPSAECGAPLGFGTPCFGGVGQCHPDRLRCQGDTHGMGYCTDPCTSDRACPDGWRCAPGDEGSDVCVPRYAPSGETCGFDEGQTACRLDSECGADALCVGAVPGRAGVCAAECNSDCGADATCGPVGGGKSACIPDACACRAAPQDTLLDRALGEVGLDRCTLRYGIGDWTTVPADIVADPYRLSFFDQIHNEPLRAPAWGRALVGDLDRAANEPGPTHAAALMVERLAILVDRPAVRHAPGPIDSINPLAEATIAFIEAAGGVADRQAILADANSVAPDLQRAVAEVIDATRRARLARNQAFIQTTPQQVRQLYDFGPAFIAARADGLGLAPAGNGVATLLNETIDYGELFGGAADVLESIDTSGLASFRVPATGTATVATSTATFLFNQPTPAGRIAIGSHESGIYDPRSPGMDGAWALLVDIGGHDTYRIPVGGNVSVENSAAVVVDLGGRDRYGYVEVPHPLDGDRLPADEGGRYTPSANPNDNGPISFSEVPRQGGARAGVAVAVDLGGDDDHYRSLRMSQGTGVFGAGVLVDDGGDDRYEAESVSQGAAVFGVGLLFDVAGDDVRTGYQAMQGFAYARAAGALYDRAGNDAYLVDIGDPDFGGDPLYANAQRQGRSNTSLSQGYAFGRRADFTDRAFMSGGVGILADAAGDDRYQASIFAQGGGFWFGTGILADEAGNDRYDGLWYAMAAGAHYALGLLLEGGGDDVYGGDGPRVNVTVGGGHDFSAMFLIDESGDDIYNASRITLGSGNVNGLGVFVDNGGNDTYDTLSDYSVGAAGLLEQGTSEPGAARRKVDTIGIFIDARGTDSYARSMMPSTDIGNQMTWRRSQSVDDPARARGEKSVGIDGFGESGLHAIWP